MLVLSLKKNRFIKINDGETIIKINDMSKDGLLIETFKRQPKGRSYFPGEQSFVKMGHSNSISDNLTMTCLRTKGKQMKTGFEGNDKVERVKGKLKFAIERPRNLDDDFFDFDTEGY